MKRRDFVKIVVAGGLASLGCPDRAFRGSGAPRPDPRLASETSAACHAVRDGEAFPLPRPDRHVAVAIVGGGPAGLAAADALGDLPYLLVEKESAAGGNATGGSWRGVGFSSGSSYNADDLVRATAADLGVALLAIDSIDGLIVRDIYVPEFFTRGMSRAPYPQTVRDAFRRFIDTYRAYDVDAEIERLDNLPFAEILKDYPREVHDFFDSFGPNNWGARVRDTSAYVGIQSASWMGGLEPRRFTGHEGFGGLTRALADRVARRGPGRLLTGATVVRVEQDGDRVVVGWTSSAEGAAPSAVSADSVIVAAPKLIARRLVAGLPSDQVEAMGAWRYIPYMVANLCFDGVVHDGCFDVNVPAPDAMSDFVCADWVETRGRGPRDRPTVLSCYMPQPEEERAALLDPEVPRRRALDALERIDRWFPGAADRCREIQVRLRGHPMHLATVGLMTRRGPLARRSFGAIHFAGTDGMGGVSDIAEALRTGKEAAAAARASVDAAARRRAAAPPAPSRPRPHASIANSPGAA